MKIVSTYSSWTRNRITPDLRAEIADEGPGEVRYGPAMGKDRGWVRCDITVEGTHVSAVGADPAKAFDAAIRELRTAPRIVGLLS
jgi:hypothetical protein